MTTIRSSLTMSPESIEEVYVDSHSTAMEDLARQGIFVSDSPEDRPIEYTGAIPENLDMLSNDELAHLMVMHQSWTAYLNGCHSTAVASKKVADRALKGAKTSIEQERGKHGLESDPRYVRADASLLYHDLKVEIISDLLKAARSAYQLMSRLISLREQDVSQTTRRHVMSSSKSRRG
jgi:hypothetical protein